jgi:cytochrome c5
MKRAILIGLLIAAPALSAQQLPDGPGAALVKSRCVVCHEAEIITQQHLSLAGWTRSIDKMVRWGSPITPQEREVLQPYLAEHFGPGLASSHASQEAPGNGDAIYRRACLTCHEAGMVEQQKLTKAGWTREVEKMTRWGAPVSDADKQPLIDYLAGRFPPR